MNSVYMDNNATTSLKKEVLNAMMPYYTDIYGNASSKFYKIGRDAEQALYKLRESVAKSLNAKNVNEIYFTGSGCEADNWAIKGIALANKSKGNHIITSKIEHHAILSTCEYLEKHGFEVTYLDVDEYGFVSPKAVEDAIKDNTILISIMTANNEIGTVEPIKEIAEIAKKHRVIFHTDAVQAIGHMKIDLQDLGVDLLSLSAHKFHGPKGVGVLYARNGIRLFNVIEGGAQERGKRAGTVNVPGIMSLVAALKDGMDNLDANFQKTSALRDRLIEGLDKIPYSQLNGDRTNRLPGNVNFSFEGVEGESLLLSLDNRGIACSSGSACTSESLDPSHVLLGMGVPVEVAHGSLRFSLNEENTEEEVDYIIKNVAEVVEHYRNISPFWEDLQTGVRKHVLSK